MLVELAHYVRGVRLPDGPATIAEAARRPRSGGSFGWMVGHIDSLAAFLVLGSGGLIVPCATLYLWFARGGVIGAGSKSRGRP